MLIFWLTCDYEGKGATSRRHEAESMHSHASCWAHLGSFKRRVCLTGGKSYASTPVQFAVVQVACINIQLTLGYSLFHDHQSAAQ